MATYLSGSNVQADGMQTLYLMNPNYAGYSDGSNTGSMVLISPSTGGVGQGNPLINSAQQQQHYIGFPMPPGLTQNSLSQHSPLTAISNSNMGHQNPSTNLFTNRIGNQTYNSWSGAGELPFLPTSDVTQVTQSLANRLTSVNSGQQSTSEVSQYSLRRQAISSIQEQQAPLLQSRVALGLNMDHSQSSAGPGQGLSLSLSPQQPSAIQLQSFHIQPSESGMSSCVGMPHVISEDNTNRGERFPNKWVGNLSTFRASSRDGIIGTGYQNSINAAGSSRQVHLEPSSSTIAGNGNLLQGSKYLKAAQQLLDEVVNVGRGIKTSPTKHNKLQSWIGTNSTLDGPFAKDRTLSESTVKDGTAASTAVPTSAASVLEQNTETVPELTPGERQELEMKKAKLMAMMDEVDRRYRQYYNQMQIVVTSFESAAGVGAAKTYTALALQTISRNFRSLRDAICGQIRVTSKALGEEDLPGQGFGRGETSRLRFVDQQLRQQRALQQLGVMQQHAWRPQRGLPERSVSVLRAWLFEHFLHPYPKDADKLMLARQTGLSRSQVSNWFINARVRLWKPMVEEMYLEETKEVEIGSAATAEKTRGEAEHLSKGATAIDGGGNGANLVSKQTQGVVKNKDGLSEQELASEMLQSRNQGDGLKQGVKKARNGIQDSGSLLSPNMSMDVDLKSDETGSEEIGEHENKLSNEDRHGRESYTISHNGLARSTESLGGFGSYQIGALGRYSQEGVPARYPGTSGVSLTLGLQHCEGLSLAGAQHHYFHGEGLPSGRRHDTASGSDVEDFYSINDQSNAYDAINFQNRKRFATQLLHHDFVG